MLRLASIILVIVHAGAASAQVPGNVPTALQPGARVRVSTQRTSRASGRVVAAGGDSLVLIRDRTSDTLRLAASELQSLELSVGQHRRRWRGAGIGFLVGATLGAALGAVTYQKQTDCAGEMFCDLGRGFDTAAGAVLLGGLGTVTGAIVGAGNADEWERVMLGDRTALQPFRPRGAGSVRVGLSLHF